ncbi:Ribonuclease_H-like superfamily [Hexamita inflata]|uniref:Ribonuclease H-like superfamily n=1 Tax=Hexamita inflata TaxID=28002 RepID=A0AA86PDH2_9EUKA|nr:Ribonuclease H-like superfamily [Hexamita inflata]
MYLQYKQIKRVARKRLIDADNSTVVILRLKQLLQTEFDVNSFNAFQIRKLCKRVNTLFKDIFEEPIDSDELIKHFERPQSENLRKFGKSAIEMWESRGFSNIVTFLEYCKVIQVSECPVERTFSEMGYLIGQRRYKLSPNMLDATFMIKDRAYEEYEQLIKLQEQFDQADKNQEGPQKIMNKFSK